MSEPRAALAAAAAFLWRRVPSRFRWALLHRSQDSFLVGVLAVLADESGRVLLLKHRFRTPYPWGLPGGFVEGGEDLAGALRRELREELVIDVDVAREPLDLHLEPNNRHLSATFVVRARSPLLDLSQLDPAEVLEAGFFGPTQLPEGMYPRHARLLERYWEAEGPIASRSS